jgi:hypothetical protein
LANAVLSAMGRRLARFLSAEVPGEQTVATNGHLALLRTIRPGDVLLVEGHSRVSATIKYLTQSTWSHAALHVGEITGRAQPDGEPHVLVEALLGQGVVSSPLSRYSRLHTRICRPAALRPEDLARVLDHARSRIGHQYDLRNMVDLARYLLPAPPVPKRWRRRMITLGSGTPTRAICSTLIAEAFQAVHYPILPLIDHLPCHERADSEHARQEILHIRHHSLYAPRDFDISPYFQIIKPAIESGFDYRSLAWDDEAAPAFRLVQ